MAHGKFGIHQLAILAPSKFISSNLSYSLSGQQSAFTPSARGAD